jgi:hypothetical protein
MVSRPDLFAESQCPRRTQATPAVRRFHAFLVALHLLNASRISGAVAVHKRVGYDLLAHWLFQGCTTIVEEAGENSDWRTILVNPASNLVALIAFSVKISAV